MIVYLAWGSLYWNPEVLPIKGWKISNLYLPLEFSRISDKGKGRLTLVIDDVHGTYNNVWYSESKLNNVNESIKALRVREKTTVNNIAYLNLRDNKRRITNTPNHLVKEIEKWAIKNKVDTVIWTDLKSNWKELMKTDYSVVKAYEYFKKSSLNVRLQILEYVYKAKNLTRINTKFSYYFFKKLNQ